MKKATLKKFQVLAQRMFPHVRQSAERRDLVGRLKVKWSGLSRPERKRAQAALDDDVRLANHVQAAQAFQSAQPAPKPGGFRGGLRRGAIALATLLGMTSLGGPPPALPKIARPPKSKRRQQHGR